MRILKVTLAILLVAACTHTSNNPGGVFTETTRSDFVPDNEPTVVRQRLVEVDLRVFDPSAESISLPLFPGITISATRDRTSRSKYGTMWTGRVREGRGGRVMFVRHGDVVVANIVDDLGKVYEIRYAGRGVHVIREIDPRKFPKEAEPEPVEARNDPEKDTCATDPPTEIDAMIVYTDDVRVAVGGIDAAEAEAFLAVEASNQSYINSDISQRLRLVHAAEVTYTESGSSLTDRNALKEPADGVIDAVHTWRNSHAADIVAMLTQTLDGCGRAYIMSAVGNNMESSAFGVVKRSCASTNLSYAHEMGHVMSARHDAAADPTNNSPYTYNHGFTKPAPTAPATPWRTVMAYDDACIAAGTNCTRLAYFSNPNVNDPVGNDAMGTANADNHLTLNNTALTVANFRCSSPSATNVWMKDTWSDTGLEPDPATAGEGMYRSPYIWVRTSQDTSLTHQHMHENPVPAATNWVYVKLQNGGATAASGTLELYYANASVSLTWPGSWTLLASIPVNSFAAHSSKILEQQWINTPGPGHFCMTARWVSASDPMATAEGPDIGANTRANNNIVWRNLDILGDGDEDFFVVANPTRTEMRSSLVFRAPEGGPNFLETGSLEVRLDEDLMKLWARQGSGFVHEGDAIRISGVKRASLDDIRLPPGFRSRVRVRFKSAPSTPRTTFYVDAVHLVHSGTYAAAVGQEKTHELGAVGYEVHTELNFKPGTTVQRR